MGIHTNSDICENVAVLNSQDETIFSSYNEEIDDDAPRDPREAWTKLYFVSNVGKEGRLYANVIVRLVGDVLYACMALNSSEYECVSEVEWTVFSLTDSETKTLREILDTGKSNSENVQLEDDMFYSLVKTAMGSDFNLLKAAKICAGREAVAFLIEDLGESVTIEDTGSVSQTL